MPDDTTTALWKRFDEGGTDAIMPLLREAVKRNDRALLLRISDRAGEHYAKSSSTAAAWVETRKVADELSDVDEGHNGVLPYLEDHLRLLLEGPSENHDK